jgi:hypothetical protein
MIPIRTLSLLVYFTYIFIDIVIYAFGSTSWSSEIIWMAGRVIADPSLVILSPCGVVPQVPILVSMTNTLVLGDHRIGHYFPQVIFVTVLEFFIKHKVQTKI